MDSKWLLKRTGMAAFVIWAATTITFALIRLMPGNPVSYLRAQLFQEYGAEMSESEINRLVRLYINVMPDEPLWKQYLNYLVDTFRGDLGTSYLQNEPVSAMLAEALPWTVFLLAIVITLQYVLGILLGATMAYFEGSRFDVTVTGISTFVISVPFYVFAFILIFIFSFQLNIFPAGGKYGIGVTPGLNVPFLLNVVYYATLPILSIVLTSFGGVALSMRANSIQVLGSDYLRGARLRGLSDHRIAYRYVARNAILPLYTGLLIAIGFLFGGAVILEQIFSYSGVGRLLYQGTISRDYPVMMGTFLVVTIAVVVAIWIADLTYGKLDPRVSTGERNE